MMASRLFEQPRERREIAPGAVHVPDWLGVDEQRRLVERCRQWARPPAMRAADAQRWSHVGPDGVPGLALDAVPLFPHRR